MRSWYTLLLSVCLLAAPHGGAKARTWVVAADGSGDFALVSEAYTAIASGDTILIRPGEYREEDHNGWDGQPIHVTNKSVTTIGAGVDPTDVTLSLSLLFQRCPDVLLTGLCFRDVCTPLTLDAEAGANAVIRNCVFEDNGSRAHWCDAALCVRRTLVEDCVFRRNVVVSGVAGAAAVNAAESTIRNCLFEDNVHDQGSDWSAGAIFEESGNGVIVEYCDFLRNQAWDGGAIFATQLQVRNCSFWANRGKGTIRVWPMHLPVSIERSIIAGNDWGPGLWCEQMETTVFCCDFWENLRDGGDECGHLYDSYNIWADPRFCDPEHGDLGLRVDSPCITPWVRENCGGIIGAHEAGCGETPVEPMTWGRLKLRYRQ